MKSDLYQDYLRIIGKLKDIHKLDVDVDHEDIHTFYKDKQPLFKLFFGAFQEDPNPSIVVSFHIDLFHPQAISWYVHIYRIYPQIAMHDSYIEDSNGETFLGEDALAIRDVYQAQDVLNDWLNTASREEMEDFGKAKVTGRQRDPKKSFNSKNQKTDALIEFDRIRKPDDEDEVH